MTRIANSPFTPASVAARKDPLLDLNRLLGRLEQNILRASAEQERRLRRDEFQRTRARYDIETARAVLTRLEQDALATKIHSRRQELQADLTHKRELIDDLLERIQDLEDMGGAEDDGGSSSEGEEDVLAEIIQTPSESMDSRSTGVTAADEHAEEGEAAVAGATTEVPRPIEDEAPPPDAPRPEDASAATPEPPQTMLSQTMRARGPRPSQPGTAGGEKDGTAQTTLASLFESRSTAGTATEEAILDDHRKEQEALSEDILRLARALKDKSLSTSRLLDEDKDVLGRVGEGLDATDRNMESAGKGMGALTRLTEGKGWWGRMILFGMVYGMMLLLAVLFLTLPKLRF